MVGFGANRTEAAVFIVEQGREQAGIVESYGAEEVYSPVKRHEGGSSKISDYPVIFNWRIHPCCSLKAAR